jgi:hypothetical protein
LFAGLRGINRESYENLSGSLIPFNKSQSWLEPGENPGGSEGGWSIPEEGQG